MESHTHRGAGGAKVQLGWDRPQPRRDTAPNLVPPSSFSGKCPCPLCGSLSCPFPRHSQRQGQANYACKGKGACTPHPQPTIQPHRTVIGKLKRPRQPCWGGLQGDHPSFSLVFLLPLQRVFPLQSVWVFLLSDPSPCRSLRLSQVYFKVDMCPYGSVTIT